MKRLLSLVALFVAFGTGTLSAQNYAVVNSERIFTSIDAYNRAITTLNALGEEYQQQVDAKFQEVESLYNNYMAQKPALSESARQNRESDILAREQAATDFQESLFGKDGALMKKRLELIQPIQKRVFDAIERYAREQGIDLVLDSASNPTLLYNSSGVDKTDAIIEIVRNLKN